MTTLAQADLLFAEGMVLANPFSYREAKTKFHECAEIRRKLLGRRRPTARALFMEAIQSRSSAEAAEQEALLREALAIFEEQPAEYEVGDMVMIIDKLADEIGHNIARQKEAEKLRALADSMMPGRDRWENWNRFQIQWLQASVDLLAQVYGFESIEVATALIALADKKLSSKVKAACLGDALRILVNLFGSDADAVGDVHKKLGSLAWNTDDAESALRHFNEVLRIRIVQHGQDSIEAFYARWTIREFWKEGSKERYEISKEIIARCPVMVSEQDKSWALFKLDLNGDIHSLFICVNYIARDLRRSRHA